MRYAKLDINKVVQVQPNSETGFVQVGNDVVVGMLLENGVYNSYSFIKIEGGIYVEDTAAAQQHATKELNKHISNLVQDHLDYNAQLLGYDNIYTAIGYIGDPHPPFNADGIKFRNWRSAVWVYVNAEAVKLQNGQRTMPTDAELVAELPLLTNY